MKSSDIFFSEDSIPKAQLFFNDFKNQKIFILVDTNTKRYCLDKFLSFFPSLNEFLLLEIKAGELTKSISTISYLSSLLVQYKAEKKSLLINLGGGVVSDIGGFLASIYNRGINYVNIPTTLLSQVDASIGGKTGVNFNGIKNKLGAFYNPNFILIIPEFLKTLSKSELISGYGEIFKYSLIEDKDLWEFLKNNYKNNISLNRELDNIIYKCAKIKSYFVNKDPFDINERKILNFGHTIGHAIESANIDNPKFNHGISVIIGIICESYITNKLFHLTDEMFIEIYKTLLINFSLPKLNNTNKILSYILSDKKKENDKIKITSISKIGKPIYDICINEKQVKESLNYFNSINE